MNRLLLAIVKRRLADGAFVSGLLRLLKTRMDTEDAEQREKAELARKIRAITAFNTEWEGRGKPLQ
jgi:hypothetical protein